MIRENDVTLYKVSKRDIVEVLQYNVWLLHWVNSARVSAPSLFIFLFLVIWTSVSLPLLYQSLFIYLPNTCRWNKHGNTRKKEKSAHRRMQENKKSPSHKMIYRNKRSLNYRKISQYATNKYTIWSPQREDLQYKAPIKTSIKENGCRKNELSKVSGNFWKKRLYHWEQLGEHDRHDNVARI